MKTFQIENDAIIFDRSDRGRPRLLLNDGKLWIFNVSHAGDYTVFTGVCNKMNSRIIYSEKSLSVHMSPFPVPPKNHRKGKFC